MYASGVPLASLGLRARRKTCCSARGVLLFGLLCKGRDVRLWRPSGVPWSPRLCASIWRGRRGTCCSARNVMYTSGVPLASLWRPSGVPWSPRLCASIWRGRRGTCCSVYASGVPLASLWRPLVSAPLCFYLAWQARDLLLCKGRDVCPGVPRASLWRLSGVPWPPRLCASIWRGRRGTCWRGRRGSWCSARGVMYALASLRASVLLLGVAVGVLQGAYNTYKKAYTHTHIHTYIRTYIHTYIHTYTRPCAVETDLSEAQRYQQSEYDSLVGPSENWIC